MTLEQTMAASAVNAWTLNVDRATKLFTGASEDRLLVEIAPGKNRLVYLFGHLIAVHDAMRPLLGIGPRQYAHLDAAFLTAADKAVGDLPSRSDLQRMWDEVHGSLLAAFNAYSPADWVGKHTAVSDEDFAKNPLRNRLSVLMNRTSHLAYHLGQCALAPKA
jgi:DinB superfamily